MEYQLGMIILGLMIMMIFMQVTIMIIHIGWGLLIAPLMEEVLEVVMNL